MLPLILAAAVDALGTGTFIPVSLLFFTTVAHLSLTTVGVLTTAGALASLPVPALAGALADRYRPRDVVLAGQVVQAAGFAAYLVARSPVAVFLAIALVAVGQRLFWSTFFTMVAALPVSGVGGDRVRDRRFAVVGMVQAAGYGGGALVAAGLLAFARPDGYLWLAVANAGTFLVSAALLTRVPAVRGAPRRPGVLAGYRLLVRDRPYLLLTAANTAFAVCSVFLGVALPVYIVDGLHGRPWLAGPVLAANTVALAVGQLAATRAVRRLSRVRALTVSGALWTGWALLTAAATAVPHGALAVYLIAVTLLYAVAELIHAPVSNALAAEAAPEPARGTYLAAFQYGFTVATIVVPVAFTVLFTIDPRLPWLAVGALAAVATTALPFLARSLPAHAVDGRQPLSSAP